MRIAIVDDSEFMRNKMIDILTKEYQIEQIMSFESIKDYDKNKGDYHLLLLDIELPNENGIDYISKNAQGHTLVIYVTSHEDVMSKAFNINVIGFVIKADMDKRLLLEVKATEARLNLVKTYNLKTVFEVLKVKENQILYFYSADSIVYVQLENHDKLIALTAKSLSIIRKDLSKSFFKVNRNYVVNLKKIQRVEFKLRMIAFVNSVETTVSRRLWEEFKIHYGQMRYDQ